MVQDVHFKTFCPLSNSSSNVSQTNNANSRPSYLMARRYRNTLPEKNKLKKNGIVVLELNKKNLTKTKTGLPGLGCSKPEPKPNLG